MVQRIISKTRCLTGEYSKISTLVSVAIAALAMVLAALGSAGAYTTQECDKPRDLRIELTLKRKPTSHTFTRYLTFQDILEDDSEADSKSVAVAFTKSGRLTYEGQVTAAGLVTLQTLADHNERSFWDTMYFENHGGSTPLNIETFTAEINYDSAAFDYDRMCKGAGNGGAKDSAAIIAYTVNKELDAGYDSFRLPSRRGRRSHARAEFGWSVSDFYALPSALQMFIYDIGKSGSSDGDHSASVTNPKYASDLDHPLCSETVSWYYYETGVEIQDTETDVIQNFRDTEYHRNFHDQFQNADRLYCFHSGHEEWIRKDRSYDWVYGDTYEPQPGDYLNRRNQPGTNNGHSMMMVEWDAVDSVAHVIDGPWNINFREVDVLVDEQHSDPTKQYDYCVGRIPFNDTRAEGTSTSGGELGSGGESGSGEEESVPLDDPPLPLTVKFPKGG